MILLDLYKKRKEEKLLFQQIIDILRKYRIDVKYTNNPGIIDVIGDVKSNSPQWMNGFGCVISGENSKQHFDIKINHDDKIQLFFRGHDYRKNEERIPVYIKYKSIKIDGKEILEKPFTSWHDNPFVYELNIESNQNISIDIETVDYNYTIDELFDVTRVIQPDLNIHKKRFIKYSTNVLNLSKINRIKIEKLPIINADVFISLGNGCRPAYWLKKYELRQYSLPFDWVGHYSLNFVIDSVINRQKEWFLNFMEITTPNNNKRRIKDRVTQMTSLHHFPMECSVQEYLPTFNEIFHRRKERFYTMLKTNKRICFVMNRVDGIMDIISFLKDIQNIFPKQHFTLINVRQDTSSEDIYEYRLNKNCLLYDIHFNDINENGNDSKTNPNHWIGNTKIWTTLINKMHLNSDNKTIRSENTCK